MPAKPPASDVHSSLRSCATYVAWPMPLKAPIQEPSRRLPSGMADGHLHAAAEIFERFAGVAGTPGWFGSVILDAHRAAASGATSAVGATRGGDALSHIAAGLAEPGNPPIGSPGGTPGVTLLL